MRIGSESGAPAEIGRCNMYGCYQLIVGKKHLSQKCRVRRSGPIVKKLKPSLVNYMLHLHPWEENILFLMRIMSASTSALV